MLRLRAISKTGTNIARCLLANNQTCVVEQKATMGTGDFGRDGHRRVNHLRPAIPSLKERIATWAEVSDIFYGPQRDLKNFPPVKQQLNPPEMRMMFIPKSFFEFFYKKTGILGPYVLLLGTPLTMFSHEIWKPDYEWTVAALVFIPIWFVGKKVNKGQSPVRKFFEEKREEFDAMWYNPVAEFTANTANDIEETKKKIYQQEILEYMYDAKKENVDLQLEIEYRQRVQSLYEQAKRKLDYQVSIVNAKKNFQQLHMAKWINEAVYSSITPQLEKQVMDSCLANLRVLAKTNKAT